jgi:hypothetical protein
MFGKIKLAPEDVAFSLYVRTLNRWKCQRCGRYFPEGDRQGLHNSHWEGRGNQATRFDPDNCVAFCYGCHAYMETRKGTEYREFMIKRLGKARFNALVARSRVTTPRTKAEKKKIAIHYRELLSTLPEY